VRIASMLSLMLRSVNANEVTVSIEPVSGRDLNEVLYLGNMILGYGDLVLKYPDCRILLISSIAPNSYVGT